MRTVSFFGPRAGGIGGGSEADDGREGAGGFGGVMERLFAPRVMKKIFDDELTRLDEYARQAA